MSRWLDVQLMQIRYWLLGDRVTKVRLANSNVMGRTPVLVLTVGLALAGLSQLVGMLPSHVVLKFGGDQLNYAWSACLILSAVLTIAARLRGDKMDAAALEIGGIVAVDLSLLTYVLALYHARQFDGTVFTLALAGTTILNCTGRALLLYRRSKELRRALT